MRVPALFHSGAHSDKFPARLFSFPVAEQFSCGLRRALTSMAAMKLAVEHVRRMRGGAQAQLMRCDDEAYYIVKFQNNPQHLRILANEMLATRLAARLGLCVPQVEVVEVRPEIIAYTPDLVMQLGLGRKPCAAGKQFGSQFPGHPARLAVHDFLPDEQLRRSPESFGFPRHSGLRQVDLQHERAAGDFFSRPRRRTTRSAGPIPPPARSAAIDATRRRVTQRWVTQR